MKTLTALLILISPITVQAEPPKPAPKVEVKLPDKLSHEDLLEVENAQLKLQIMQSAYGAIVARLSVKYSFDATPGSGDDVNLQTGIITRKAKVKK